MASSYSALLLGDSAAFTEALRTLINNPQFSDVTFLVGGEQREVFAHRCLLSCRCQAFHAMLSQPQEMQAPLLLSHVQPEVFLAVIEYLYTNSVTLNNAIALEVLTSSMEYGLNDLRKALPFDCLDSSLPLTTRKACHDLLSILCYAPPLLGKLCVEFIKDSLTVEQACEALQAAVAYGQMDLQLHCLAFIENHTQEVVHTRGFLELSELAMQTILQSDCLAIDEVELIHAVQEWAHVGSAVFGSPVHDVAEGVVRELRLALLSPSELTTLEKENKKDQMISIESLAEAWKMHALWKGRGTRSGLCRRRRGTLPREHHRHLDPQHK